MSTTTARSWAIGVTAVIATAASLHLSEGRADSASYTLPTHIRALNTPCPAEDSLDCFWNAHQQGNGHGASFVAIRIRLLGRDGRRIGVVGCHQLNNRWDRYSSCQILHRRSTTSSRTPAATTLDGLQWILNGGE